MRGDYENYEDALRLTNLESLDKRRGLLGLKFAKNCLKNENFAKLFPLKETKHAMNVRNPDRYVVKSANTERYKKSTIPFLQRQLNLENNKKKIELKKFLSKVESRKYCQ